MMKKLRRLVSRIFRIVEQIFYLLARFLCPINKNLIILESEPDFSDNAYAFYKFLKRNTQLKYIWSVENPQNFENTCDTIFVTRFSGWPNIKYYYYLATAKYNFYTHWTAKQKKRKGQIAVYLGHGIGYKRGKGRTSDSLFDFATVNGPIPRFSASIFLGRKEQDFRTFGYPRNDMLLENVGLGLENPFFDNVSCDTMVLWMPTFRQSIKKSLSESECDTETGLPLYETKEDLKNLDLILERNRIQLQIKIHHLQADKEIFKESFSNIKILTDSEIHSKGYQLYEVIGKSDALITDYSSVANDYLLLDKPIAFILDDIEIYEKNRGFTFEDVRKVMPGDFVYTKNEFEDFVIRVKNRLDKNKDKREQLINQIHSHTDNKSSYRIAKYVGLL